MNFESQEDYEQYVGRKAQEQMEWEQDQNYSEYLESQQVKIRPFEDLIKPIEIDGETFVPIEEIFLIQINRKNKKGFFFKKTKTKSPQFRWVQVSTSSSDKITHKLKIRITTDDNFFFEMSIFENGVFIGDIPIFGIVTIVKNLIKWGFIEP